MIKMKSLEHPNKEVKKKDGNPRRKFDDFIYSSAIISRHEEQTQTSSSL